ncbi:DNA-processing protein DprA [Prevotella sp. HUN102]|uniref:DNA-processing protein DprA n=1 Tax=Prevotella sp. HUN102 TaxID=1392486 RepID=UPI00048B7768|nr:DNA-processing protein DprA [Prevotella sp. HUN102]
MDSETLYAVALARISYFNSAALLALYQRTGSATAVIENRNNIRDILPDASPHLVEGLQDMDNALKRAEEELKYNEEHGIKILCFNDADYPQRMRECADAPLVLFYKGNADLNKRHTINIVGTRHCTTYGQELIRIFTRELQSLCPDVLVFSGLAYGIDIAAHREALSNGIDTVGVVAHGLDDIYPRGHRETATKMIQQGGLLTEYTTRTQPIAKNFVQRNRIVAGCSDATVLIESAAKGGGLITCSIARSYHRDVFAFPGAIGAEFSEGCNNLIRDNGASLITSACDLVKAMNWDGDVKLEKAQKQGIERSLFPDLSADEQAIVNVLKKNNDLQINLLSVQSNIAISRLTALLFELEMKGVVKTMAGGCYHLLG